MARPWPRVVAGLLALAGSFAAPGHAAAASAPPFSPPLRLPLYGVRSIAVDPIDGYVFVTGTMTQGGSTGSLMVAGIHGQGLTILPGLKSPQGIAIIGHKVYVAEQGTTRIAVVDASTSPPSLKTPISTGSFAPKDLTVVDGDLYFTHDCSTAGAGIGVVPTDGSAGAVAAGPAFCGQMASSAALPHTLFIAGTVIQRYDTSSLPITLTASAASSGNNLVVTADGAHVLARANPSIKEFSSDTLATTFTYSDPSAASIALGPDASHFYVVEGAQSCKTDRFVEGQALAEATLHLAGCAQLLVTSQDGSLASWVGLGQPTFHGPGRAWVYVMQTAHDYGPTGIDPKDGMPYLVPWGHAATVDVQVGDVGAPGDMIELWAAAASGDPVHLVEAAPLDGTGIHTTFSPIVTRTMSYYAYFPGNGTAGPSWSLPLKVDAVALVVGSMLKEYRDSGKFALYHRSQNVYTETVVKPNETGDRVTVSFEYKQNTHWVTFSTHKYQLRKHSRAVVYFPAGSLPIGTYRFTASTRSTPQAFEGHSRYAYWKVTS